MPLHKALLALWLAAGSGAKRAENVVMLLEWAPDADVLRIIGPDESAAEAGALSEAQEAALVKAHELLGFHARTRGEAAMLDRQDVANAVEAAADVVPSASEAPRGI